MILVSDFDFRWLVVRPRIFYFCISGIWVCDLFELILLIVQSIDLSSWSRWLYSVGYSFEYLEHGIYEIDHEVFELWFILNIQTPWPDSKKTKFAIARFFFFQIPHFCFYFTQSTNLNKWWSKDSYSWNLWT